MERDTLTDSNIFEMNTNIYHSASEDYSILLNSDVDENESHGIKFKGMEHVPNIFMSFDKYSFLEVINILI